MLPPVCLENKNLKGDFYVPKKTFLNVIILCDKITFSTLAIHQIFPIMFQNFAIFFFLKNGPNSASFGLFSFFYHIAWTNIAQILPNDKRIDSVLGSRTRAAKSKAQTNPISYGVNFAKFLIDPDTVPILPYSASFWFWSFKYRSLSFQHFRLEQNISINSIWSLARKTFSFYEGRI